MRGNFFFIVSGSFLLGIFCRTIYTIPSLVPEVLFGISVLSLGLWFLTENIFAAALLISCVAMLVGIERVAFVSTEIPEAFRPLLHTYVTLVGKVATDPDVRETSDRVTILIEKDGASTKIIAVAPLYPSFSYGEQVTVSGMLESPQPFDSSGGRTFRYDQFLAKDGVYGVIQRASIKETGPPQGIVDQSLHLLYSGKAVFIKALERALPEPYVSLAVGILVGGKQGLGPSLLNDFTIAGMLQIVVLSGYNVMIVAGSILKVSSRLPRLFGLSIAALAIVLFVIAAGANSSAIRAGIMAILSLLAQGMYRKYDVLRALIASLVLMVLINPLLLVYDPGLQLSFLATMGLILGSQPIQMHLLWMRSAFFEEAVATTLSAQVAVLPFLLYESGNLSLVALPANIAVMPVVPIAMAASALSAVVSFVLPFLGPLAGLPAYICLWYIVEVAKVSARLPFAQFIVPAFSAWWMFGAYALLMFAVIKMRSLHHFA